MPHRGLPQGVDDSPRFFLSGEIDSDFSKVCSDRHWQLHSIDQRDIEEYSSRAFRGYQLASGQPAA